MDIREMYKQMGADYDELLGRLGSARLIDRVVRKFPSEPNYQLLLDSVSGSDWETAFRAAHTLKGVALNLEFSPLAKVASDLCESLRGGKPLQDAQLLKNVEEEYARTMALLQQLD